ncbi:MAG TPA: flagellar regulator YcgR PilZN domain-containing protein [Burkholderiales bacterium]|nr:flagellar regulator YcgR PilZN domain-containing protein [Burkholderiales bacterium]
MENPEFLVRSKEEVLRLLNRIAELDAPLSMSLLNASRVLDSSVIYVDEYSHTLLVACPPELQATLKAGGESIMLRCVFEDSKIEFQAGRCAIVELNGKPVVGIPIPDFMWRFQRRRDPRRKVAGLKIVLNLGVLEADAEVVDLAVRGIGINCDGEVKLQLGETLHNCSIALPGVGQIPVDLVVQNQFDVQLADGRSGTRIGCQFTGLTDSARQMIQHYLEAVAGT